MYSQEIIRYFSDLDAKYVSEIIAIIAILVTIILNIKESKRTRSTNQVSLIIDLYNRFHSDIMFEKRIRASEFLLTNRCDVPIEDERWSVVSDILDFFQILGTLAKSGHINKALLHNLFFYWQSNYWKACEKYIVKAQVESPATWGNGDWLYKKLTNFDEKMNKSHFIVTDMNADKKLDDFFKFEISNLKQKNIGRK